MLAILSPVIHSGEYKAEFIRRLNRRLRFAYGHVIPRMVKPIYLTNQVFDLTVARIVMPYCMAIDLIDDFAAFDWAPPHARQTEADLLRRSSIRIAGTGTLRRMWLDKFQDMTYIPSGVDFEKLTRPVPEPEELRRLPGPRILYVGSLSDRMNGELFVTAAKANSNGSVVVVGPVAGSFPMPSSPPPNLHFLGLKPHDALPGFYQHVDLGIMPFADTPAARAINPVKSLEFLACGLPLLSTPIPDVMDYYEGLITVEPPHQWSAAISRMLAEGRGPDDLVARRVDIARRRSWRGMVDAFEERLREFDPPGETP